MCKNICVLVESERNSKLLALFSTLKESDKDLLIKFTESLVERCKENMTIFVGSLTTDKKKESL
jgi:hypothetical protein